MNPISRPMLTLGASTSTCPRTSLPSLLCPAQKRSRPSSQRNASSYRRQRKLLNVTPAPTFGGPPQPTGSSGRSKSAKQRLPPGDHIVFSPPSTAPNVYHTPLKFLPKTDARKQLFKNAMKLLQQPPESTPVTPPEPSSLAFPAPLSKRSVAHAPVIAGGTNFPHAWPSTNELPPPVRVPYEKKYHLTPEDFEEMRKLRRSDENYWTRNRIAAKFGCSQFFVGMVVQASAERLEKVAKDHEKWIREAPKRGGVTLKTRQERRKRQELWKSEA